MYVVDNLVDFALDIAKEWSDYKLDEMKLREDLREYLKTQKKYNEICELSEEIDFQGLVDYISGNMIDVAQRRFFSIDTKKRNKANEEIIDAAFIYSGADTSAKKAKVRRIVNESLTIIGNAFKKRINLKSYFLMGDVVEAVKQNTDDTIHVSEDKILMGEVAIQEKLSDMDRKTQNTSDMLLQSMDYIKARIDNCSLFSYDKLDDLVARGNIDEVELGLNKVMEFVSSSHPLKPYYGYSLENGILKSVPLTDEAVTKYPPKMWVKGTVRAGDHYFNDWEDNPIDYSYRHQISLVVGIEDAIKLLGKRPDPRQYEAEVMIGKKLEIKPPEFPPAFPCSIKVCDRTFYDYILLRTQEILDDGTYIVSNREQENPKIYIEFRMKDKSNISFKIRPNHSENRDMLNYCRFIQGVLRKLDMHVYRLDAQEDFLAGSIRDTNAISEFHSVDEEADFLERVCFIEDCFNVKISLPKSISERDSKCITQVSELVMKKESEFTWRGETIEASVTSKMKDAFKSLNKTSFRIEYTGTAQAEFFGTHVEYRFKRTLRNAVMQDIDKIVKLADILEVGDPIKISFKPGEDNTAVDRFIEPLFSNEAII